MQQNTRKQFKVTDDIMAKPEQRFLNWVLDTIALILIAVIFIVIISVIAKSYGNKTLLPYLVVHPIGQYTFVTIIRLMYYICFETWFGRTAGKFVTQTIVVDENGERVAHEVILIRTICRLIPFYELSYLFNPNRWWHDIISKTYVVNKTLLDEKKRHF